jgi:hypothetical protein
VPATMLSDIPEAQQKKKEEKKTDQMKTDQF